MNYAAKCSTLFNRCKISLFDIHLTDLLNICLITLLNTPPPNCRKTRALGNQRIKQEKNMTLLKITPYEMIDDWCVMKGCYKN